MIDAVKFLVIAGCVGATVVAGCSNPGPYHAAGSLYGSDESEAQIQPQADRDPPPTAKTLHSLATILATQGKDRQCEFVLNRCIQQYPRFRPAHNSMAELLMRQGRVREATSLLSEALAIRPDDPVLLNNLGMCLLIRKEYGKALDCFAKAAGERPENKRYRANMAVALGLLGRYDEALALLQQVLPEDRAVHNIEVLRQAGGATPPSVAPDQAGPVGVVSPAPGSTASRGSSIVNDVPLPSSL